MDTPGIKLDKTGGYADCWYCNDTVVNAQRYQIETRDGQLVITVCRKRRCRESAEEGHFYRNDS